MKTLHLTLKKKWFDKITSGEKKEEYREIKPYWIRRLLWLHRELEAQVLEELTTDLKLLGNPLEQRFKSDKELFDFFCCEPAFFEIVSANNGYAKDCPNIKWKHGGVSIGKPNPLWCEPEDVNKTVFILSITEILKPQ